jgi:hypothetical protein
MVKPGGHLWILVFGICCAESFLSEVDVEALRVFSIEIVCSPKQLDEFTIVVDKVIFWKVEIFLYPKVDEDIPVLVIQPKSSFHVI